MLQAVIFGYDFCTEKSRFSPAPFSSNFPKYLQRNRGRTVRQQRFSRCYFKLFLYVFRSIIPTTSQPDVEILQPVNLVLSVQRNLSAAWYHDIPAIGIKGDLKPMQVMSQQTSYCILRIDFCNG